MIAEFTELPLRRQEARRAWVAGRTQHLEALACERRLRIANEVGRQLSAIPRALLGRPGGRLPSGGPVPDKKHLVELRERLSDTVGLEPVKQWVEKTVSSNVQAFLVYFLVHEAPLM
jgi:hypothetical protein